MEITRDDAIALAEDVGFRFQQVKGITGKRNVITLGSVHENLIVDLCNIVSERERERICAAIKEKELFDGETASLIAQRDELLNIVKRLVDEGLSSSLINEARSVVAKFQ